MTNFNNIENFSITHDRHKGLYGPKLSGFKESYDIKDSEFNYMHDPDWSVKMKPRRNNLKLWFLGLGIIYIWI
jgi:hypothetical protein